MRKTIIAAVATTFLFSFATPAAASCDPGEVVIKFSHWALPLHRCKVVM